ncbi:MAG: hypothetical protein IPN86_12545 [Saprospiraceae bacterium]|nr:hypothetical protein [Saprospiraceae bacterium]
MKSLIILFSFMSWWVSWPEGHPTSDQQKLMIDSVNKIRQKGCYCGKRFMKPVQK